MISNKYVLTCADGSLGAPDAPPALDPRLAHDDVAPVALHLQKSEDLEVKSFVTHNMNKRGQKVQRASSGQFQCGVKRFHGSSTGHWANTTAAMLKL